MARKAPKNTIITPAQFALDIMKMAAQHSKVLSTADQQKFYDALGIMFWLS
jgi:hypothetical protein